MDAWDNYHFVQTGEEVKLEGSPLGFLSDRFKLKRSAALRESVQSLTILVNKLSKCGLRNLYRNQYRFFNMCVYVHERDQEHE